MHCAPGVDVVVCNYQTPGDLGNFLASLYKHPPSLPWTAWIMNVAPHDLDTEQAEEWRHQINDVAEAHHITFEENVGYARAVNSAISHGQREFVAIFNADVVLTEHAVDNCVDALMLHPGWGIVGPRQVDNGGKITAGGIFGTVTKPRHRGFHENDRGQWQDVRSDATYVAGSALFASRAVIDELIECDRGPGTFFLNTPLYYEETFACRHALEHGYRNAFLGTTTITHLWHASSPVGSQSDKVPISKEMFRQACAAHGMECE